MSAYIDRIQFGQRKLTQIGKRLRADCNRSVGFRPRISNKPRLIAQITSFSKNSSPRLPIKIHDAPFNALFYTGAARNLLHINVFNKIVLEQISLSDKSKSLSDKSKSLFSNKLICTESDVELYDIHNKPLLTKWSLTYRSYLATMCCLRNLS